MNKRSRKGLQKRHEATKAVIKLFKVLEDAGEGIELATAAQILGLKENTVQGTQAKLGQAEAAAKMVGGTITGAWTRSNRRWAKTATTTQAIIDLERYRDAVGEDAAIALDVDDRVTRDHERTLVIEAVIVRDHGWIRSMTLSEARAMIDETAHLHANDRSVDAIAAIRVEGAQTRRPSDGTPSTPWADPRPVARATIAWGGKETLAVRIASAERVERRVVLKNPRNQVMRARIARDLGDLTGWTTHKTRTRTRFVSELATYKGDDWENARGWAARRDT